MRDESWLIVDTETNGVMTPIHAVEIATQRMRGWRREAVAVNRSFDSGISTRSP